MRRHDKEAALAQLIVADKSGPKWNRLSVSLGMTERRFVILVAALKAPGRLCANVG
jgi:hypothetical protein